MIRPACPADAPQLAGIYNHYITQTTITFEEEPLTAETMAQRVAEVTRAFPWLVACADAQLLGYAYAARWKDRAAYRHTVEASIYLAPEETGRGLGTLLYRELFRRLAAQGFKVVIAGIALPNPASIALHEKLGFRKAGHFSGVGSKFGRTLDVGYWLLQLECQTC